MYVETRISVSPLITTVTTDFAFGSNDFHRLYVSLLMVKKGQGVRMWVLGCFNLSVKINAFLLFLQRKDMATVHREGKYGRK